ncbi:MAG: hypothetical protein KDH20_05590 [Rhodocyclaceae bacterium]|nr:hypothetical protein [Rhodocyclaceae bacterium]
MSAIGSNALSGLNSAALGLQVSAHNVANASTAGFTRQERVVAAQPEGGVSATVRNASQPGTDLERDLVDQMQLSYEFKANVLSLKAEDEMLGQLLDLTA